MLTVDESLIIVGFLVTAIGFVPLYQEMFVRRRERELNFEVERIVEGEMWSVRIRNPNKTIERLNVLVGTTKLIVEGSILPFEVKIPVGGGQNFRIPLDKVNPSQEIVVIRDGDKVLKKIEFKKIVPVKP